MCKYCEDTKGVKMDMHGKKFRDLLPIKYSSIDFIDDNVERMANIIPPTPISKRQHKEDGFTSIIEVYVSDDRRRTHHVYLPIRFCPMCGRDLSND